MPHRSEIPDFSALLCEKCGYVLDELDQAGDCPECGVPIHQSLPRERPGSAYQRHRGIWSLIRTWLTTLIHPRRTFDRLRIDEPAGMSLMWRALFFTVLLPCVMYLAAIVVSYWQYGSFSDFIDPFFVVSIIGVFFWIAGVVYTTLAVPRLKFLSRQRGMRMDNPLAWTIAGQASIGLTLMPLSIVLLMLFDLPFVLYTQFTQDFTVYEGPVWIVLQILSTVLILGSIPMGILGFELLLWIGSRRLRFRNRHNSDKTGGTSSKNATQRSSAGPRTDIT